MDRANMVHYLASSADELASAADKTDPDQAIILLREAAELLALGSSLLQKDKTSHLTVITKEAA